MKCRRIVFLAAAVAAMAAGDVTAWRDYRRVANHRAVAKHSISESGTSVEELASSWRQSFSGKRHSNPGISENV